MKQIIFLLLLVLTACAHTIPISEMSTKRKVQAADELMSRKKYRAAQEIYEKIVFECKGDTLVKKAQYQLANCYYHQKLYENAVTEYEELLHFFPVSQYSADAEFKIGVCWYELSLSYHYDQEETKKAIKQFELFLKKYPDSAKSDKAANMLNQCKNKLLAKKYENGFIYYKMGYYNAALMYLNEIFDENINGEIDRKALVLAAKIYHKKRDKESLSKVLATAKQKYPNRPSIKIIEQLLAN
jgi:outer membrane protein assembly factor BamD